MENTSSISQYMTFKLGDEFFGIDVMSVREVLDNTVVTKLPQTPDFMLGVINLRGSVVPVVDLRLKFGMTQAKKTRDTCIVVMEIAIEDELTVIGGLVDSVQEVLDLPDAEIEPPPKLGTKLKTEFIRGMGKINDQFLIILNIADIFSTEELIVVQDALPSDGLTVEEAVAS